MPEVHCLVQMLSRRPWWKWKFVPPPHPKTAWFQVSPTSMSWNAEWCHKSDLSTKLENMLGRASWISPSAANSWCNLGPGCCFLMFFVSTCEKNKRKKSARPSPGSGSLQEVRLRRYRLQLQRFLARDREECQTRWKVVHCLEKWKLQEIPQRSVGLGTAQDTSTHGEYSLSILQEANRRMKDEEICNGGKCWKMMKRTWNVQIACLIDLRPLLILIAGHVELTNPSASKRNSNCLKLSSMTKTAYNSCILSGLCWLFAWFLVRWSVSYLLSYSVGWSVGWLVGGLVGWSVGCLGSCLVT